MKKSAIVFLLSLMLYVQLSAQVLKKKEIKLFFDPQLTKESSLSGRTRGRGTTMHNGFGFNSGLLFSIDLNEKLWLNSGIGFFNSSNKIYLIGLGYTNHDFVNMNFRIIKIPIGLGYDLTRWLRINSGISLDYQYNKPEWDYYYNQTGLGVYIAADFSYNISELYKISLTPNLSNYAIISLGDNTYNDRLLSTGISIGISKRF